MEESIQYLEKLRKKASLLLCILCITGFVVMMICLYVFTKQDIDNLGFYISILVGAGVGYLMGHITGFFNICDDYKARFKATFVEVPMRNAFTEVFYDGKQGIDEKVIENTGIMSLGNRYFSNDYVKGCYNDVKFERADVRIQQHHSNGKTSYTVTYLHGRWLIFEFNKNFHFDLQIIGKGFPVPKKKNSIFTEEEERRHRIKLEDMEFNEMFQVFCQDEHEAYYLLTPQFMSVLMDMNNTLDGSIMLGFIDNQLHIAIHNEKDAMEPRIFDSIDLTAVKAEVQKEIDVIINIIDSLGLDRDIYKSKD